MICYAALHSLTGRLGSGKGIVLRPSLIELQHPLQRGGGTGEPRRLGLRKMQGLICFGNWKPFQSIGLICCIAPITQDDCGTGKGAGRGEGGSK